MDQKGNVLAPNEVRTPQLELMRVEIAKLSLRRGDYLVATLPNRTSQAEMDGVRNQLQSFMPPDVKVLCKVHAVELSVLDAGTE